MDKHFIKCFFCNCWDGHVVFVFSFVDMVWCITLTHIWWTMLVNLEWISLGHNVLSFVCVFRFSLLIFWWEFASIFMKHIGLYFFFWLYLCLVLVSGWWWLHRISFGVFHPLQSFEEVERMGKISFLYVWYNLPVKPSGAGLLFVGNFFFNYRFYFTSSDWPVQIICFLSLIQFWCDVYFYKVVHFF